MKNIKQIINIIGLLITDLLLTAALFWLFSVVITDVAGKKNLNTINKSTTKFINTQIKNLENYANDR